MIASLWHTLGIMDCCDYMAPRQILNLWRKVSIWNLRAKDFKVEPVVYWEETAQPLESTRPRFMFQLSYVTSTDDLTPQPQFSLVRGMILCVCDGLLGWVWVMQIELLAQWLPRGQYCLCSHGETCGRVSVPHPSPVVFPVVREVRGVVQFSLTEQIPLGSLGPVMFYFL